MTTTATQPTTIGDYFGGNDVSPSLEEELYNAVNNDVVTPNTQDILMGRGNSHKNHPGNIIFQGLIKTYRKQYFQVDTLVNKRNTIVEIISHCHRNGARFLEQKPSSATTSESSEKKDNNNSMVWTILTKERTFRKVSLAIQYRQRCNTTSMSKTTTTVDNNTSVNAAIATLSPTTTTNPVSNTTSSSPYHVSPSKVSPGTTTSSTMHNKSLSQYSDNGSSPNAVQSTYMDHHSNHNNDNHYRPSYNYGYHQYHPPSNRVVSNTAMTNPGNRYDGINKVQDQSSSFVMSNGMVVAAANSNNRTDRSNQMKNTVIDEFKNCYEDSMHWTHQNNSHGNQTNNNNNNNGCTPWSLPFISNAMSTLPPFQSSIHLRQRDDVDHLNISQHSSSSNSRYHHHHRHHHRRPYNNDGDVNMIMSQTHGRYNMDPVLYAPATRPQKEGATYGDHHHHFNKDKGDDNTDSCCDPIPITNIFGISSTSLSNHDGSSIWDHDGPQNMTRQYDKKSHNNMIRSTSTIISPQQQYSSSSNCNPSLLPPTPPQKQQQHQSFIRRVSDFNNKNNDSCHSNDGRHHINEDVEVSSENDNSIATIETAAMSEFHHIITMDGITTTTNNNNNDNDTHTTTCVLEAAVGEVMETTTTTTTKSLLGESNTTTPMKNNNNNSNKSIVVAVMDDDNKDDISNTFNTTNTDDDSIMKISALGNVSISDSSSMNDNDNDDNNSILYNDLCLSPLSFITVSPKQQHQSDTTTFVTSFLSTDSKNDMFHSQHNNNKIQPIILQIPFL